MRRALVLLPLAWLGCATVQTGHRGLLFTPGEGLHREILAAVGLPTAYPAGVWPSLREAMGVDKKARGARLRLVVLDALARPSILDDPPEELLWQAYQEVSK